jgi:sugar phosphate isomerase/epimerase
MNDMKSRREFLKSALCAGIGISAVGALTRESVFAAESAGKMRLGLATYQWGMIWDIPTLIANLQKAKVLGVELRTQSKYKHGVELELNLTQRTDVKKRFADSPVAVVAIACSERMDWPEPAQLKAAIEASKKYLQLSHDVGSSSLRVFPNQFHPDVPKEKTIGQIAKAVNELGAFAAGLGQRVDLEAHGPAGQLETMKAIMDQVTEKTVGVRLNCDKRDTAGAGLEANFNLVKDRLAKTVHLHNLKGADFPYQQQIALLVNAAWEGWTLMENTEKEPDLVAAMIEQREIWQGLLEKARKS